MANDAQMSRGAREVYDALVWYLDEIHELLKTAQGNIVKNPGLTRDSVTSALTNLHELRSEWVEPKLEPMLRRKAQRHDAEQASVDMAAHMAEIKSQVAEVLRRLPTNSNDSAPAPFVLPFRREG